MSPPKIPSLNNVLAAVSPRHALVLAFVSGALLPLAFAPFAIYPLAIFTPAILFALWLHATPRVAAARGYAFGLGFFIVGVSWIYFSLHDFGNMPAPLAAVAVLLFVAFISLYIALIGWAQAQVTHPARRLLIAMPALWALAEWLRGWVLTGFPWLNLGYSQIDAPLAGLAPYLGVYGVSAFTALSAALLVFAFHAVSTRVRATAVVAIASIWLAAWGIGQVQWTTDFGAPVRASLIQGNVPLAVKWRPEYRTRILDLYSDLTLQRAAGSALVVWPETAAPTYLHDLQREYIPTLQRRAQAQGTTVVFGVIERRPDGQVYNAVVSLGPAGGIYRKRHLVPFGEYLPFAAVFEWLLQFLQIPMSDFSGWDAPQTPLVAAGQRLGVSICYEDAFGEEVIAALPAATLLINVSEDAWFGDSLAPHQHLQMARMRARETERYLLRATNTGISAMIDARGRVFASAPGFRTEVISGEVQPRTGATPYVRLGNWPIVSGLVTLLLGLWLGTKRR